MLQKDAHLKKNNELLERLSFFLFWIKTNTYHKGAMSFTWEKSIGVVMVSTLLTLNIFHTLFQCIYS